jgi:LPXTG-site transpeptidase (sortase) family protein
MALRNRTRLIVSLTLAIAVGLATVLAPISPANAAPALTIQPLTWNVVGLDSNDVNVGPNNFPVGARVCNTGSDPAANFTATFVWDSSPSPIYIELRPGSLTSYTGANSVASLLPGRCHDFYFEVQVSRDAAAYGATRRYHIRADADGGVTISSTTPREIYVERLISQSRNSTTDILLDGVSVPAGGTMTLMVGNTYNIQLVGATATNGYEQIETFINFLDTIFRVNSVITSHVTLASGRAGPFRSLKNLRWGDTVIVHYAGQRYVYSVRSTSAVMASDASIFPHEERPWVTLVTCGGYDATLGEYRYRIAVKAVLTSIEPEP